MLHVLTRAVARLTLSETDEDYEAYNRVLGEPVIHRLGKMLALNPIGNVLRECQVVNVLLLRVENQFICVQAVVAKSNGRGPFFRYAAERGQVHLAQEGRFLASQKRSLSLGRTGHLV